MIQQPATDEMYDELHVLAAEMSRPPVAADYLPDMALGAPGQAAAELIAIDATGEALLDDDQVARLWLIAFTEGLTPEEVVPDSVLARSRPERRTRPPKPLLFPLRGGGHTAGNGTPGKREFPARWDHDTAIGHVMSVAREPAGAVQQPDGTFRAWGVRDGVDLRVILSDKGKVHTAYPVAGDGVVTNPLDELRAPLVARLRDLIDRAKPDGTTRTGLVEMVDAGEWDEALAQLRSLGHSDEELLRLAGLT
jgi:hypothetical protein